ncbi:MAG: DUF2341 domain-containing protein [Promethearchaeota archaeon]
MRNIKKIHYALILLILLLSIANIIPFKQLDTDQIISNFDKEKDLKSNNSDWLYYRKITLSPTTIESDYQIRVQLSSGNFDYSKANPDGSDLRFFDQYNNNLDYWIENWDTLGTSNIWVKIPSSGTAFFFMKYGKPSAISQSDGSKVFMLFDDFEGTTLDTNIWEYEDDVYSSVSLSNSIITLYTNSPSPWASHALLGFHSAYIVHGDDYGYKNYIAGASFTPSEDVWVTGDFRWEEPSFASYYEGDVLFSNDSEITETSNPVRFLTHSTLSGPGLHYGAMISTLNTSLGVQYRALRVRTRIDLSGLSEIMIDWAAVRKWSDPEPLCTVESEFAFMTGFYDDFENGLTKWETISGLWHLTDTGSAWPDPCRSPIHSMWFGQEATGTFETGAREYGDLISVPFNLFGVGKAFLEFFHWREGEGGSYDVSYVYISPDGSTWDLLYSSSENFIAPWEKISLDISKYVGNATLQLRFFFDTLDSLYNAYRGWLVDDIQVKTYDLSHDLNVDLEIPSGGDIFETYKINATVMNIGIYDESNVDLFLYLGETLVDSLTISNLPVATKETLVYDWIPTEYGVFNFTVNSPAVINETFIENNILSKFVRISKFRLFDGMYLNHSLTYMDANFGLSYISYSYKSGETFNATWDFNLDTYIYKYQWDVDFTTRLISNGGGSIIMYPDGSHDPAWIYTDVSIGDIVPIGVWFDGDHLYNVTDDLVYDLPGFGPLDIWVLEDLTYPGGLAWYDKKTGILLNGTFYYSSGYYNYTFDFIDTNVEFIYALPPEPFSLTSSAGTPDDDGDFVLIWDSSDGAKEYSVYQYDKVITEVNESLIILADGITDLNFPCSGYVDGSYYFIVVAQNEYGDTLSNYLHVEVFIPPSLSITSPDNTCCWEKETPHNIYWTSTGSISSVKIELYVENNFVMEIISDKFNDGVYYWTVPSTLVDSEEYQIKISDVSNPSTYDFSEFFEIKSPTEVTEEIPGYSLYLLIGLISIISVVLLKKRYKFIK